MKKMLSILASLFMAVLVTTDATAQYQFFTGGTLNFQNQKYSEGDDKLSRYAVLPYIGYMASDNLIVGMALGVVGDRDGDDDNYSKVSSFRINPFARYRKAANEATGIYGEFGVNVDLGTAKTFLGGDEASKSNTTSLGFYAGPGIDYAFSDRWVVNALWGALRYENTSVKDVDGSLNEFGLNINPANIRFSLNYMF